MKRLCCLFLLVACQSEQGIKELRYENIAVVNGDFDNMKEVLTRLDIAATEFEGFISQPVYGTPEDGEQSVLQAEGLFQGRDEAERTVMLEYDAIFVNSGVRGLGDYVYNGVDSDDDFVADPVAVENIRQYISNGRTMVISDWAGDLIEATWPDKIEFVNESNCDEEPCWDASQVGVGLNEATGYAVVNGSAHEELVNQLGSEQLVIDFDFSHWTVIKSVADDVDVYLSADIEYRISGAEGYGTMDDVPLLVGFDSDRGRVVFSAFHWYTQNPALANQLMLYVAEGLNPGPNAEL